MTVADLIEYLQTLPPETKVFYGDYYYDCREGILEADSPSYICEYGIVKHYEKECDNKPVLYFD